MFFILSKLLIYLTKPFLWILIVFVLSLAVKKEKLKKILRWTTFGMLFFFSNTVIHGEFLRLWEVEGKKYEQVGHYEYAVVLTGMASYNNDLERLMIRNQADRIWQALNLYHKGKVDKIIISGDSGTLTDKGLHEAQQFEQILKEWGIPEQDIIAECKSQNTHENAKETVRLLRTSYPHLKKGLLITSASHMRRANACFDKEGLQLDVFTTDQQTGPKRSYYIDQWFIPNVETIENWEQLIKEWIGYVAYSLVGYI